MLLSFLPSFLVLDSLDLRPDGAVGAGPGLHVLDLRRLGKPLRRGREGRARRRAAAGDAAAAE